MDVKPGGARTCAVSLLQAVAAVGGGRQPLDASAGHGLVAEQRAELVPYGLDIAIKVVPRSCVSTTGTPIPNETLPGLDALERIEVIANRPRGRVLPEVEENHVDDPEIAPDGTGEVPWDLEQSSKKA